MIFALFNQVNKHKAKIYSHHTYTQIIIKKRMVATRILELQIILSHRFYQHELCSYTFFTQTVFQFKIF